MREKLRQIDDQGRILVPMRWLEDMGLGKGESVHLEYDEGRHQVTIRPYRIQVIG